MPTNEIDQSILVNKIRPSFTVFMNDMILAPKTGYCAEIGVSKGYNAETMLKATNAIFILVDDYSQYVEYPDAEESAKERLSKFGNRAVIMRCPSVVAAKTFVDGKFDYVYLDAGHKYNDIKTDLEAWWPKVCQYGLLAGHDFCEPDVARAVKEFADKVGKVAFGITPYSTTSAVNYWNFAQMCDWWIFKNE